ncbi:hypothetical protein AALP_AA8G020100 [Arabis alpina]|uniref:FBD domain-containing protein n=1 Tax=Arabis alpina TaxID=50452 RepID=A0A087G4E9_ARAAL|nr:hypothetical protein AALP_AA8G020100 [Arabis alpina]
MVQTMLEKLLNIENITFGVSFLMMLSIAEFRGVPFPTFKAKTLTLETKILQYVAPGLVRLLQNSPGLKKIILYAVDCFPEVDNRVYRYLDERGLNLDQRWRLKNVDANISVMVKTMLEKLENIEDLTLGVSFLQMLSIAEFRGVPFPTFKVKTLTLETRILRSVVPGLARLLQNSPEVKKITLNAINCFFEVDQCVYRYLDKQELHMDQSRRLKNWASPASWECEVAEPKLVASFVELLLENTTTLETLVLRLGSYFDRSRFGELTQITHTLSHDKAALLVMVQTMLEKLHNVENLTLGVSFLQMLSIAEFRGVPFPTFEVKTLTLETRILRSVVPGLARLLLNSLGLKTITLYAIECNTVVDKCVYRYLDKQGLNLDQRWRLNEVDAGWLSNVGKLDIEVYSPKVFEADLFQVMIVKMLEKLQNVVKLTFTGSIILQILSLAVVCGVFRFPTLKVEALILETMIVPSIIPDEPFAKILSGSPLLESLTLHYCKRLERLDLSKSVKCKILDIMNSGPMHIVAPHIHSLELGHAESQLRLVDVSSLTEAELEIYFSDYYRSLFNSPKVFEADLFQVMIVKMLEKLQNVVKFTFTGSIILQILSLAVVCGVFRFPTLKVEALILETMIPGIAKLLQNSPRLKKVKLCVLDSKDRHNTIPEMYITSYLDPDQCWKPRDLVVPTSSEPKLMSSVMEFLLEITGDEGSRVERLPEYNWP